MGRPSPAETHIELIAGAGAGFGNGHRVRLEELRDMLAARGYFVSLQTLSSNGDRTATAALPESAPAIRLRVLDARDVDPAPVQDAQNDKARLLTLDNRHPERARYAATRADLLFHDTLPHPDTQDLASTLNNALIGRMARDLLDVHPVDRRAFAYSGGFADVRPVDDLLTGLLSNQTIEIALRCGLQPPDQEALRDSNEDGLWHAEAFTREDFLREIASADWFATYFGMSMLEAWYLGRGLVLYDFGSSVHGELMRYLQNEIGLLCLSTERSGERPAELAERIRAEGAPAPQLRPDGRGYERLIERIEALLED